MNLINDAWIPAIRQDGTECKIAPWQIGETENPVIELCAPRADFQGALYQFLIGLLQTCVAPADIDEWGELNSEPSKPFLLREKFGAAENIFELYDEVGKPAFLQDLGLNEAEEIDIAGLLIDTPGENALKKNLDLFVKRERVYGLCASCTSLALFTTQTNGPPIGTGYRAGMRGAGPMTTLVFPAAKSTLWQKLWLNVLDQAQYSELAATSRDASIFPWMAPTRVSDATGCITLPEDAHPLQMYWSMPQRIRLCEPTVSGDCDLCGCSTDILYSSYRRKQFGVDYEGAWIHPLTPYRFDLKNKIPPFSKKFQKNGLSYRYWLGLLLGDNSNGDREAKIISDFFHSKSRYLETEKQLQIWCFGFDLDKGKARCWYEYNLPAFHLQSEQIINVQVWVQQLLLAADESRYELKKRVKEALFRRPEDAKGDVSFIDTEFWEATENDFYRLLAQLAALPADIDRAPPEIYSHWRSVLYKTILALFDRFALQTTVEDLDLKRVVKARDSLIRKFNSTKSIKLLNEKGQVAKEVAND